MQKLRVFAFGVSDPLSQLRNGQGAYLRCYLADLGCTSIVEEPVYFDANYLAEFAAFYSVSTRGYPNRCSRLHFFSSEVRRDTLKSALEGRKGAHESLQEGYLGFAVIRPIPAAPLGRTVLRWYSDTTPATPRVVAAREYESHLAGLKLKVRGLAWQQQDTGVGACATVAIWSMLHATALDESYAIPTTVTITQAAHRKASFGDRLFPSQGLRVEQLLEAIKECGLEPMVVHGDCVENNKAVGFSPEHFGRNAAAMIRSGYPMLICGPLGDLGLHAVCAVGFREVAATRAAPASHVFQDAGTEVLYIHDDNLGPNVRFRARPNATGVVELKPEAPPKRYAAPAFPDPAANYGPITPTMLVAALHPDIRISPRALHRATERAAKAVQRRIRDSANNLPVGLTLTARFTKVAAYLDRDLAAALAVPSHALGSARLALVEQVPPMSLRIGVGRIGVGDQPLLDVLFDTTDTDRGLRAFCSVAYHDIAARAAESANTFFNFGTIVRAF